MEKNLIHDILSAVNEMDWESDTKITQFNAKTEMQTFLKQIKTLSRKSAEMDNMHLASMLNVISISIMIGKDKELSHELYNFFQKHLKGRTKKRK